MITKRNVVAIAVSRELDCFARGMITDNTEAVLAGEYYHASSDKGTRGICEESESLQQTSVNEWELPMTRIISYQNGSQFRIYNIRLFLRRNRNNDVKHKKCIQG